MSSKKKKKDKGRPLPKINIEARLPRPRPVSWAGGNLMLEHAREYLILECWVDKDWGEHGLARVVVAREQSPGRVLYAIFLVDYYCLGIKNCDWKADVSLNTFHKRLPDLVGTPEPCEPGFAHQLIYGALNYAARWGFEPHPDFKAASQILEPRGTFPEKHDIQFGLNGKPFFISGPYDNPRWVINKLMETAGEGNFDYLVDVGGPGEWEGEEEDFDS